MNNEQIGKMIELDGMDLATNYQNAKNLLAEKICCCVRLVNRVLYSIGIYNNFGIGSIASWSMSHQAMSRFHAKLQQIMVNFIFLTRNSKPMRFGRQMPKTFVQKKFSCRFTFDIVSEVICI